MYISIWKVLITKENVNDKFLILLTDYIANSMLYKSHQVLAEYVFQFALGTTVWLYVHVFECCYIHMSKAFQKHFKFWWVNGDFNENCYIRNVICIGWSLLLLSNLTLNLASWDLLFFKNCVRPFCFLQDQVV